jgi:hypothetical protein
MSIRNYTLTSGTNIGKIGAKHLAIDVAGSLTASITVNGSLLINDPPGGGTIETVNTQTGIVVLSTDDIDQTATREYVAPAEKTQITTNQNDILALQGDVTTLQGDVTALQLETMNNNGINELLRNVGASFPYSVVPIYRYWEYEYLVSQSIPNNAWTQIINGAPLIGIPSNANFDVNGQFAGAEGVFLVEVNGIFASNATGQRQIRLSSVELPDLQTYSTLTQNAVSGLETFISCMWVIYASASFTFQVQVFQTSGSDLDINSLNYRVTQVQ